MSKSETAWLMLMEHAKAHPRPWSGRQVRNRNEDADTPAATVVDVVPHPAPEKADLALAPRHWFLVICHGGEFRLWDVEDCIDVLIEEAWAAYNEPEPST